MFNKRVFLLQPYSAKITLHKTKYCVTGTFRRIEMSPLDTDKIGVLLERVQGRCKDGLYEIHCLKNLLALMYSNDCCYGDSIKLYATDRLYEQIFSGYLELMDDISDTKPDILSEEQFVLISVCMNLLLIFGDSDDVIIVVKKIMMSFFDTLSIEARAKCFEVVSLACPGMRNTFENLFMSNLPADAIIVFNVNTYRNHVDSLVDYCCSTGSTEEVAQVLYMCILDRSINLISKLAPSDACEDITHLLKNLAMTVDIDVDLLPINMKIVYYDAIKHTENLSTVQRLVQQTASIGQFRSKALQQARLEQKQAQQAYQTCPPLNFVPRHVDTPIVPGHVDSSVVQYDKFWNVKTKYLFDALNGYQYTKDLATWRTKHTDFFRNTYPDFGEVPDAETMFLIFCNEYGCDPASYARRTESKALTTVVGLASNCRSEMQQATAEFIAVDNDILGLMEWHEKYARLFRVVYPHYGDDLPDADTMYVLFCDILGNAPQDMDKKKVSFGDDLYLYKERANKHAVYDDTDDDEFAFSIDSSDNEYPTNASLADSDDLQEYLADDIDENFMALSIDSDENHLDSNANEKNMTFEDDDYE